MGFYWALFLTVLLTAVIAVTIFAAVIGLYSLFFDAPLWFIQWVWNRKLWRWRYVEIDEFDKNYCPDCGSRLTVSFEKEYSEVDGRVKHAEARVTCRNGMFAHVHFKTVIPPALTSRKVNYRD